MTTRQSTGRGALAAGFALLACAVAHSQQPATFTPEQLRQDVAAIEAAIARTHPDIAHSVDPAVLGWPPSRRPRERCRYRSLKPLPHQPRASPAAQDPVTVGGAPMYPNQNIIENTVNSKDHTTLVAAVKAAGLVDTLQGPGPFTVLAPVNAAFAALPAGTVETLLKPENKGTLTAVLTYHVVPGRFNSQALIRMIKEKNGKAMLKTVQGEELTVTLSGDTIALTDAKGGTARVSIANVSQSNGVIHVIDKVLMP